MKMKKSYNNGPRKGMMYGGAARRKPMMYGGMATKKPRKKAYGGGKMTATQGQQNQMQNQMMQQPKSLANTRMMGMSKGDIAIDKKKSDLNKDGKLDEYETARGKAIQKAMSTRTA